ncbi:hypothetical protein P6709_04015 [Jeotgalibacillus sp. ET6]|uniref:hypothetical protein n=1 Tax=Jeotgalibacillus sp. ET6 TaxID=3037260 RepID=UPI0024182BB1|nr:hypothetical protein [Jeotgalibacillus sp. ET6]MDG5470902.1 hypothetical protein [Jeotgalibacillus sp. ET6]
MNCPCCNHRDIGKIGTKHYYCRQCCIEFLVYRGKLVLYEISEDGSIESLNDLFNEAELMSEQKWIHL